MSYGPSVIREVEFRVNAQGAGQALLSVEQALADVQRQMISVAQATAATGQQDREKAKDLNRLNAEYGRLIELMAALEQKVLQGGLVSFEALKRQEASARALLELSRGIEDFAMAGFRGALNNIPMMIYSMGQAAGWSATRVASMTASVSLFTTALYLFVENYPAIRDAISSIFSDPGNALDNLISGVGNLKDSIIDAMSATYENTMVDSITKMKQELQDLQREITELEQKSRLTSREMERLTYGRQRFEELTEAVKVADEARKLFETQDKETRDRAAAFSRTVQDFGGPQFEEALQDALNKAGKRGSGGGLDLSMFGREEMGFVQAAEFLTGLAARQDDRASVAAQDEIMRLLRESGHGEIADLIHAESPEGERELEELKKIEQANKEDARKAIAQIQKHHRTKLTAEAAMLGKEGEDDVAVAALLNERIRRIVEQARVKARTPEQTEVVREMVVRELTDSIIDDVLTASVSPEGLGELIGKGADKSIIGKFREQVDLEGIIKMAELIQIGNEVAEAREIVRKNIEETLAEEVDPKAASFASEVLAKEVSDRFQAMRGGREGADSLQEVIDEARAEQKGRKTAAEREAERQQKEDDRDRKQAERELDQRLKPFLAEFAGEIDDPIEQALVRNRLYLENIKKAEGQEKLAIRRRMQAEAVQMRHETELQLEVARPGMDPDEYQLYKDLASLTAPQFAPMDEKEYEAEIAKRLQVILQKRGVRDTEGEVLDEAAAQAAAERIVEQAASEQRKTVSELVKGNLDLHSSLFRHYTDLQDELNMLRYEQSLLSERIRMYSTRKAFSRR